MSKNTPLDLRTSAEAQLEAIAAIARSTNLCSRLADFQKIRRILTNLTYSLDSTLITWEQTEAEIAELNRQAAAAEAAAADTSADLHEQIC